MNSMKYFTLIEAKLILGLKSIERSIIHSEEIKISLLEILDAPLVKIQNFSTEPTVNVKDFLSENTNGMILSMIHNIQTSSYN